MEAGAVVVRFPSVDSSSTEGEPCSTVDTLRDAPNCVPLPLAPPTPEQIEYWHTLVQQAPRWVAAPTLEIPSAPDVTNASESLDLSTVDTLAAVPNTPVQRNVLLAYDPETPSSSTSAAFTVNSNQGHAGSAALRLEDILERIVRESR